MKNTNRAEKIGFLILIVGIVLMILDTTWEANPIPSITHNNLLFTSIGLLIWALGHMKKQADDKKKEVK